MSYTGRCPTPSEISTILSYPNISEQTREIRKKISEKKSLLPISNYTEHLFAGRLLELTRHNLIKKSDLENPLSQLSLNGAVALSEIINGRNDKQNKLSSIEAIEIIYLIYYILKTF